MTSVRTWVWRATIVAGALLLATGVWLSFFYRPAPPGSDEQLLRAIHRATSIVFPLLALALGLVVVVDRRRSWPAAVGVVVLALALSFTGYLLPWDQLALYAVTVGTNMRGLITAAFDDRVKFLLIGSTEISQATVRTWFIVHGAVLPVALAACLLALRRRSPTVEGPGA